MKTLSEFSSTLKEHMAADKKKTVILFVLGAVLLGVVGRLLLPASSPESAEADDVRVVAQPSPPEVRQPLIRPVPEQPAAPNPRMPSGEPIRSPRARPASSAGGTPVSVDGMARTAARDLFSTSAWDQFPSAVSAEPPQAEAEPTPESPLSMRLEEREAARKQAMEVLLKEIAALDLQSTLTGQVRSAYISGRLVHEGERISGFSVVRIEDRQVILEKSGVRQALPMP